MRRNSHIANSYDKFNFVKQLKNQHIIAEIVSLYSYQTLSG